MDGTVFDGYGTLETRRKTFYKNELLKINDDYTEPTKIKSMDDANKINLVKPSTNRRRKSSEMVGSGLSTNHMIHSRFIKVLHRQMLLSHQIKMIM